MRVEGSTHSFGKALQDGIADGGAVQEKPLVDPHEMRRSVPSNVKTSRPQRGVHQDADRALPVRAGDMDRRDASLRIAQRRADGADGLQSGTNAESSAGREILQIRQTETATTTTAAAA